MLHTDWDEKLRLYITAIVQNEKHKMLAINNVSDHLHFFIGLNPDQSISEMMKTIKRDTAYWINKEKLTQNKFNWQEGYGAFTHSRSQINSVVQYIHNQQKHHEKISFLAEYKKMLQDFEVDFDERYIFTLPYE